ncbi:MAG: hypothetical protein H7334_05235 [Ferruginibacter sp.]|nr:hypothetical protein [Ferruginibacter sp.]
MKRINHFTSTSENTFVLKKKNINEAGVTIVRIIHAMLKIAPDDNDGWDTMPEKVEADVKAALKESEKG